MQLKCPNYFGQDCRYPITKSGSWIPVIGHPHKHTQITYLQLHVVSSTGVFRLCGSRREFVNHYYMYLQFIWI